MAVTRSKEHIPEIGDKVVEVKFAVDAIFVELESGKSLVTHISGDDIEEVQKKFDPETHLPL